jgi:hypothetical protein
MQFLIPVAYQVLQHVEEETWIIVAQIDVKERNGLTNDGTQQSTQISSPNVDHEYEEPIEELNTLLLNTPTMRKWGLLQLPLQLNFWLTTDTYNSSYFYNVSANEQVALVAKVAIHRIYIWIPMQMHVT